MDEPETGAPGKEEPSTAPATQQKGPSRTVWIVVAVVVVLVLCACATTAMAAGVLSAVRARAAAVPPLTFGGLNLEALRDLEPGFPAVSQAERQFEQTIDGLESPLTVRIENQVGDVHVTGADVADVEVTADLRAYGLTSAQAESNLDQVTVIAERVSANEVTVRARFSEGVSEGRSPAVDIRVRVPRNAAVVVNCDVGGVTVTDVTADVTAICNVGAIEVTGVEGAVIARSDVGRVTVEDWVMTGDSEVRSDVGAVRVVLNGDPEFELDARTNVGRIRSDFQVAGEPRATVGAGQALVGPVGENPSMRLVLRSGSGAIVLERGR